MKSVLSVFKVSSFAPAFLFLSPRARRALVAVYAFARVVDDAVDDVGVEGKNPVEARKILSRWRTALLGGSVDFSQKDAWLWAEWVWAQSAFSIPVEPLLDLVSGVERDLDQTHYRTFSELREYCHGVAGTVGLACLPIFGLDQTRHKDFAVRLGLAVQLVNILRDVKADAQRGHFYLPEKDRVHFGLSEDDLLSGRNTPSFRRLMERTADRARLAFSLAHKALPSESRRLARPALVMGALYQKLLDKMEKSGFDPQKGRTRLSLWEKITVVGKFFFIL